MSEEGPKTDQNNMLYLNTESKMGQEKEVDIVESKDKMSNKEGGEPDKEKISSNTTIFRAGLMLTNMCLGTSIFTFSAWTKSYGLVWILVFCVIIAAINYWSSSRVKSDDFSEITEEILGKKARVVLNIFIIIYSYAVLITFFVLIFALFGRFVQSVGYQNDYATYDDFSNGKWGKAYIKYPLMFGVAIILSFMSLIKDIDKLNFSSFVGVVAVIYTLFVVMIECDKYYKYYKDNVYKEDDKSTHVNWVDLSKAFTKELDFFKGFACIVGAYCCHTGVFPVFAGFKYQENGIKKMNHAVLFSMGLTTVLHFISMICSVVIYRKAIGNGKDIAMTISKLFITLSLMFTVPGYFFGLRLGFANSFTGGKISKIFNIIFTFASMILCALIAALYDKILNYLSYIGGFVSVFICYLFPALLHVFSSKKPLTYWRNLFDLILAILLRIIGVIAGIRTIIDDVS